MSATPLPFDRSLRRPGAVPPFTLPAWAPVHAGRRPAPRPRLHALVDFDEPEPPEEFDDDDIDDEDEERNALTDVLGLK